MPALAEPPAKAAADSAPDPLSTSLGQVFKATLAKTQAASAEAGNATKASEPKPDVAAIEAAKAELAREQQEKTAISEDAAKAAAEKAKTAKPKSALDVALGDVKTEPTPIEEDVLAKFDEKNPDWKKAREVMKIQSEELKKFRAEMAKAGTVDPATKQQLETVQRERNAFREEAAKLKQAVVALNVDYDPETQAKFVEGKQRLLDRAAERTKEFGGDAEAFREAMKLPIGKKQTEAMRDALLDVDEIDRPRILALVEQVRSLDEEYAELKKDPQQAWKTLSERRQAEQQAAFEESERAKNLVMDKVLKGLPEKAKLFTRVDGTVEGADDWNNGITMAIEYGKHLMSDAAQPEEVAAAAYKAGRYDFVENLLLTERARYETENAELRASLAKYESSDSGFTGRSKRESNDPLAKTPAEIWKEEMAKKKQAVV